MNQKEFKRNVRSSFANAREDMEDFKSKVEKYLLHILEKQNKLEEQLEELRSIRV